ncbi:MAG: nascent polypeptide-associated complex protein [Nitrososphaerales archaeon]
MAPSFDNRQARRMLDRMGVSMDQFDNVEEVVIRMPDRELVIKRAEVAEIKSKATAGARMFQVTGEDVEERQRERPTYTKEDIILVAQQANVNEAMAEQALKDSNGDLAQAVLRLST